MANTRRAKTGQQTPAPTHSQTPAADLPAMPSVERIQQELASAKNLDDFFGKEGIFAGCSPRHLNRCSRLN
jgi:hypothetical protein